MDSHWRSYLWYRLSQPACLLALIVGSALGVAQFVGRFAYSDNRADIYAFGWPLTYSAAVYRHGSEAHEHFAHLPPWSLCPRWYWSRQRLCIDALVSVVLLTGTLGTAEVYLRRWPHVQFTLPQLLLWMASAGAVLSVCMPEATWASWIAARISDEPSGQSVPLVSLSWHVRFPVMFSLWCTLDAFARSIGLEGLRR